MTDSDARESAPGSAPSPDRNARRAGPPRSFSTVAGVVACAVVGYYLGFLTYLAAARNDPGWDHLMFLLSGLEAVVFAAGGLLFGTTIQRGAVLRADAEAGNARAEAQESRKQAKQYERQAVGGEAVAVAARRMPRSVAARGSGTVARSGDLHRRADLEASEYEAWHATLLGLVDAYFPAAEKEED